MRGLIQSVGPAIVVTAVVLGPGSILTSSRVGASIGLSALWVVAASTALMIAMVALAARLGVAYERSLCGELAARLGRPVSALIGLVLFTLVALFQSSNNLALIGGLEPLVGENPLALGTRILILGVFNGAIVAVLYRARDLYRFVEGLMKILVGLMVAAFLANFLVVFVSPRAFEPAASSGPIDWLPLLGMVGTTFSVAGAFYQAYLVKQKGWGPTDLDRSFKDSVVSITILGTLTAIILMTAWRTFYGNPSAPPLGSVGEIARQLEPLFGSSAKGIFCVGILAGGASSFLVNAIIGGTVLSDSIGKGWKLSDSAPKHLTMVALLVGMVVAMVSLIREGGVVHLITFAQALTILGIPVLGLALVYLGTRPELVGERRVPRWIVAMAIIGFLVSCVLAWRTGLSVYSKLFAITGLV